MRKIFILLSLTYSAGLLAQQEISDDPYAQLELPRDEWVPHGWLEELSMFINSNQRQVDDQIGSVTLTGEQKKVILKKALRLLRSKVWPQYDGFGACYYIDCFTIKGIENDDMEIDLTLPPDLQSATFYFNHYEESFVRIDHDFAAEIWQVLPY